MIFNKKYTYKNEKLETIFSNFRAEHYSMYDTYFKNKWILRKCLKNTTTTINQL